MIDEAVAPPALRPPPPRDRWRKWWLLAFALAIVVGAGFAVGRRIEHPAFVAVTPSAAPASSAAPSSSPVAAPAASPSATPPKPVLRLPGAVPTRGSGRFAYAAGRGPVLGDKGQLRRFRVAVEKGSDEDPADFARQVVATLGDARSWIGGGRLRLQKVGGADPADFTVYLATRDTAGRMCLNGGTDIRVGGRPYTSCRTTGKAIINLDRWRLSAPPYLSAKVPLSIYRQYVINHEVGHELGHHHQGCPRAGGPAPVMVQQTLTLRGCRAYAWPRLKGKALSGPQL
jgi:hypothetical protein